MCIAKYLKLTVRVSPLRTVNTALPANQFAGELVGSEVFERLHGSTAEWTAPTCSDACCFGHRSRTPETLCNEQLAAKRYARLTITVG